MTGRIFRVALVLILANCWEALSFSSRQIPLKTPTVHSHLFGRESFESLTRRRNLALASSSVAATNTERQNGFFRQFRRMISFPLRFLIFGPLRILQLGFLNKLDLDDENTAMQASTSEAMGELNGVSSVSPTVNIEDSTMQASTSETIGELNDVSLVSPALTVDVSSEIPETKAVRKVVAGEKPAGDRWAVASDNTDLTGSWQVIVTEDFKKQYDAYLERFGQPLLVRTVALGIIGRTTEDITQEHDGRSLSIRGVNARGVWQRTLVSSGTEVDQDHFTPVHVPIKTADSELVQAESWWELDGSVHVSFLRGVNRYYGGGKFESRRYLEDNGETYVCESIFHFTDETREPNKLIWRFRKRD